MRKLAQETLMEAIPNEKKKMLQQIQKILKLCDLTWDGEKQWKKVDVGKEEVVVDWQTANEKLWELRNNAYDKKLKQKK